MSTAKRPAAIGSYPVLLGGQEGKTMVVALIGAMALLALPDQLGAGALNNRDFANVSQIERSLRAVLRGLTEATQSPNVVPDDSECIRNTLTNHAQGSCELST